MNELSGIITPAISPFNGDELKEPAIEKLMVHLHQIGVSGVFPMGSNGSSPFISNKMHKRILEVFSKYRSKDEYFVPGVGKNNIEDTLELSEFAADINSDAIVVVTPYYLKVSQKSIYSYFDRIVGKVDLPVILYNIPQLTGNTIRPETVLQLSENYSNIVGIKDSSGDLTLFQDYLLNLPKKIKVFQGQDELLLPSLVLGAAGGVCGSTNFIDLATKVMKSFKDSDIRSAARIQRKLSMLKSYLNTKSFPQVYSFLFHKLILKQDITGTPAMLDPLEQSEMGEIYHNVTRILDQKVEIF
ncbi:MAG: dihydrodipicolinate synthase family protein [Candidatus Thermoplasmatota archaeon]|jgi:4-hydroxy-tetrahydrodipicolinate synthase/2-dehydro-3-deoxy-D-gluconate aldolase|nr:dihydrodipicolinate synthase family protein [Candidatus Thermoplasmatota archaeon]